MKKADEMAGESWYDHDPFTSSPEFLAVEQTIQILSPQLSVSLYL